jgi:hypothetical protein
MSELSGTHKLATTNELWLESEFRELGLKLGSPPVPTPGGLAILIPDSQYDLFNSFNDSSEYRIWEVRGTLAKPAWAYKEPQFLKVTKAGIRMSTAGSAGNGAFINFHFRSNSEGHVEEICARVEERTPAAALARARHPLELLLDETCALTFTPLRFTQFHVAVSSDSPVLATETFLPFGPNLEIDSYTKLPPDRDWLWVIDELFREAMCANSPYYRLLVAFRIVEAISILKKFILETCRERCIDTPLPKNPKISKSEIYNRGATIDPKLAKKGETLSLQELYETWRDKRNAVAHLLFERLEKTRLLVLSRADHYRDFACSAAILLHYSRHAYWELRTFLLKHIAPYPEIISVEIREAETDPFAGIKKLGVIGPRPTKFYEWGRGKP